MTSVHSRSFTAIGLALCACVFGGWVFGQPARADETAGGGTAVSRAPVAAPDVISFATARDHDQLIFAVVLPRPDDMASLSVEFRRWRRLQLGWPRLAELTGSPAWQYPCYLEFDQPAGWEGIPRLDRLTFVGRCPAATQTLHLQFRYPLDGGGWHESQLVLQPSDAQPLETDPAPIHRWAAAQAASFTLLAECAGDVGGFYTFASQQTRRQYELPEPEQTPPFTMNRPPAERHLYDVTTGALAVQESLQLDRMTDTNRDRGTREIAFADIPAVGVKSHPFDQMRGGVEAAHSELARLVPEDFYYLRFGSLAKLYELLDFADQWGTSLLRLATPVGSDYGVQQRVHTQLCLPDDALARLLAPAVIGEIAIVGSDPYVCEGSDITVLFGVTAKDAFQVAVDQPFARARELAPDARHEQTDYRGVTIESLVDARRRVSCYRCWLDDVCAYSNSLPGLQRVIDTRAGERPSLAATADFKYMRATVFPLDPASEDGFLYLSDAFIRRLVGPEVRIKEKRRLEVITSLKMIANAALLHGYQFGPGAPTLDELGLRNCLTLADVFDPDDGKFTWDAERGIAHNSTYNDLSFLTPLIEIGSDRATAKERDAYAEFRDRYQEYWRRYFDPIGVRVKVDQTIRIETCILPLIDLTEYEQFEDVASGEPVEIRLDRFTPSTLLRFVLHVNDGTSKQQALMGLRMLTGGTNAITDWVGDWATFWIEDTTAFERLLQRAYAYEDYEEDEGPHPAVDVFNASFVLGVHVKNKLSLTAFLVALRSFIETTAPNTVIFRNFEPYHDISIVQIAPDPSGDLAAAFRRDADADDADAVVTEDETPTTTDAAGAPSEDGPAVYYAVIGDAFYISTQATALRNLVDRLAETPAEPPPGAAVTANIAMYAAPSAAELARPAVAYLLEQQARQVSLHNMAQVWLLGRCGVLERLPLADASANYLGYHLVCPDGGAYTYDARRADVTSTVHGALSAPVRRETLPADSPLASLLDSVGTVLARLNFTEHGIATTVEINRR